MFAVIKSGGKQYRVQSGDTIKLESLKAEIGSTINFNEILMVGEGEQVKFGSPLVEGCQVTATVISQGRYKKIEIVKFRRRKHHEKWQGHRQHFTEIKINDIQS